MADDTNVMPTNENLSAETSVEPKQKKARGPRRAKIDTDTATSVAVGAPVKTRGPGRKNKVGNASAESKPVVAPGKPGKITAAKTHNTQKGGSRIQAVTSSAGSSSADGFAELMHLEEENQKLRKALSDKLRAENADLRKKLGIA